MYELKVQNATIRPTFLSISANISKECALSHNYPDPFSPTTTIRYDLRMQSTVTLEIYNVLGQRAEYLNYGLMDAIRYNEVADMSRFASGVYFYTLVAEGNDGRKFISIKKLVMMR